MAIQQSTQIPEIRETIVMLRQLSADEQAALRGLSVTFCYHGHTSLRIALHRRS